MAGPGIVEIISLLMGMSGFGVQANPKAPTADASLQYALPDPDVVVHFDAIPVVPNNYKALTALPNNPAIRASKELSEMIRKSITQVEGARGMAKAATGIDVVTDVYDATVFLKIKDKNSKPDFVAAVHGKFTQANLSSIARLTNAKTTQVGSALMVESGGNDPALGVTKDGVLIAGTPSLVRERLADSWRAPRRSPSLAYAAEVLAQKPVYSVVMTLGPSARKLVASELGTKKNLATDIITRHRGASFSVYADGIGWTWSEASKAGLDNMEMMSQGLLELIKTAHVAPRAFAKIAISALDSYKGVDKRIDDMIRRKADIQKLVATYTGDGNFTVAINKDVRAGKLSVRATGKSLSEVVPAGLVLPMGALFLLRSDAKMEATPMPASTRPVPARPVQPMPPKKK